MRIHRQRAARNVCILTTVHPPFDTRHAVFIRDDQGWNIDDQFTGVQKGGHHARPFISDHSGEGLFAIWSAISDYHGSPYTEWQSSIIGAVAR